eukprot:NODE_24096_length_638_cov_4.917808.p1 GENE.NODE_24096_length_638_cov_4.917808~~NODE_24096_length_638_cov_4.917808.p1  ORF type:complete len:169 (+),score=43.50 NODE_24096_length_638_cov_4.917808:33-509(+)
MRDRLRDRFTKYWNSLELDIVLCPVFPVPAPPVEELRHLQVAVPGTRIFNLLDYVAGVIPATTVAEEDLATPYDPGTTDTNVARAACAAVDGSLGLPVCVQVVGLPYNEELVLRAMQEMQDLLPFAKDRGRHAALKPIPRRCVEMGGHPMPHKPDSKL